MRMKMQVMTKGVAAIWAALLLGIAFDAEAAVEFGAPFTDGMVLQREMKCPVWGKAAPGEKVTVSFGGQRLETTADAEGHWKVALAPMAANRNEQELRANDAVVKGVLVGEVWLCCGQSNMVVGMWGDSPRAREGKGYLVGQLIDNPLLRFAVLDNNWSERPLTEENVVWRKATPKFFTNDKVHGSFSAVGSWFGIFLQNTLKDIPVGLVGAYSGGVCIETWIPDCKTPPPPPLAKSPVQQPSRLHNGKVNPILPFAMRGAIWYQGESNTHASEIPKYASRLKDLHDGWRKCFDNEHFKLYVCQLCPWGNPLVPQMQEMQQQYCDGDPDAGLVVLNDVGNIHDIHPNDKETVGLRLACLALKRDYGFDVKAESPKLKSWKVDKNMIVMTFDHAESFYVYDPEWRHRASRVPTKEYGFEVCGKDGKWFPAYICNFRGVNSGREYRGQIDGGNELRVYSDDVKEPVALRYLHSRPWRGYLMNEAGLPLGAFHVQ